MRPFRKPYDYPPLVYPLDLLVFCWIWIKISRYGEIASPALALLAENGETKKLEIDMKRSSDNIRSVIKARY